MVHKACPCVVVNNKILVFEHPFAGFQIPKGTVEAGESVESAVLRELYEESGIQTGKIIKKIGELDWEIKAGEATFRTNQLQRWHLYLVDPGMDLPVGWSHRAEGSEAESGLIFRYFWQSFDNVPLDFHPVYHRVIEMTADLAGKIRR